jgi:hypothetical protein
MPCHHLSRAGLSAGTARDGIVIFGGELYEMTANASRKNPRKKPCSIGKQGFCKEWAETVFLPCGARGARQSFNKINSL